MQTWLPLSLDGGEELKNPVYYTFTLGTKLFLSIYLFVVYPGLLPNGLPKQPLVLLWCHLEGFGNRKCRIHNSYIIIHSSMNIKFKKIHKFSTFVYVKYPWNLHIFCHCYLSDEEILNSESFSTHTVKLKLKSKTKLMLLHDHDWMKYGQKTFNDANASCTLHLPVSMRRVASLISLSVGLIQL